MITPSFSLTATERVLPKLALDFTTAALDSRVTFTRTTGASNPATYVASNGYITAATNNQPRFDYSPTSLACKGLLIEESRVNLALYSSDFTNAYWTKALATITANATTAPNGTTTADRVQISNSARGVVLLIDSTTAGTTLTFSLYAKANGQNLLRLFCDQTCVYFQGGTIVTLTNEWVRYSLTVTATQTGNIVFGFDNVSDSTTTCNGTNGTTDCFVWGAQLNIGSTAKPYFPTTDRLNVPRLTYQNGGGGCPSLLLEKQSTNLAQYSQALNTVPNVVDASTATANVYVSPDGTQNAMRFTEVAINDRHGFYQYTTVTAQTYTASIFTKQTGRRYIAFTSDMANGTSVVSFFDLQTISVVSSGGGHTCSIQDFGNGWLRLIVTLTVSAGAAGSRYVIWGGSPDGTTTTYTGSTSISQTFWGYQLEASSYPTSYIPTTSASATRVIDDCRKTGISSLIGQTEGTMFIDLNLTAWDSNSFYFGLYGGGNEIYFRCAGTGAIDFVHYFGATQAFITKSGLSLGRHKLAACYKNNDWAFYVDGILVGTDTSGTFSGTISQMVFGYTSISAYPPFQSVNQTILFKTRLTNAELASLTTL